MRNQELISTLYNCAAHCFHCADACLDEQDVKEMVKCIRLDKVCGATCIATAKAMAINVDSGDISGLVKYCQEICEKCAEECDKHSAEHCKKCAEACRKCAEACSSYVE